MSFFVESENGIRRSYELTATTQRYISDRARIEIVPTALFGDALYLDGCLQFARKDEYIYHEMLVHPAMSISCRKRVCILGGGDGCALREVLKWPDVEHVTVIDWDARLVYLFQDEYALWNLQSFHDPRVDVEIADILNLADQKREYDVILVDLLDPNYADKESAAFWQELLEIVKKWTHSQTTIVFNAGGYLPWEVSTLQALTSDIRYEWEGSKGVELLSYHIFVPSFANEWCFFMIRPSGKTIDFSQMTRNNFRYFNESTWTQATLWTHEYKGRFVTHPVKLSDLVISL